MEVFVHEPYVDDSGNLVASEWVGHGSGMLTRRSALQFTDPRSYPQLWKKFFFEPLPDSVCEQIWGEKPTPEIRARLNVAVGLKCPICGE